ncbi:MAG: hypothetical protein MUO50_10545 [Longimicrobiales bacterium]|nr:hypothetical protein [Longimicrobiales bacterium]
MGLGLPGNVDAQIISPGKLSRAHGELEGMGSCTQCHQLRTPGADRDRCLKCHESLSRKIESGTGYHGRLNEKDCGVCHKEHLGEDFRLIRMDPDTFPHLSTGYVLQGAHNKVECRGCHTPDFVVDPELRQELSETEGLTRTYMGLDQQCGSCHRTDGPHQNQFAGRDCGACHTEVEWESVPAFDHDRTPFQLDGRHQDVECNACHNVIQSGDGSESVRYTPLEASDCVSCHEDPHDSSMKGGCNECHGTAGWNRVNRSAVESTFDHEATDFSLVGAHSLAECRTCHSASQGAGARVRLRFGPGTAGRSYPKPEYETCTSCHLHSHEGDFGDRSCDTCHSPDSWVPPDYDRTQHQMELRFDLSGSHAVLPCSACHEREEGKERRLVFRFDDPDLCSVCHQNDDPHEGAFRAPGCDLCHQTTVFGLDRFDHGLLERAGWAGSCGACHETDSPHEGQFQDQDCRECHGTDAYAVPDFDHKVTRFPLAGAHADVPCGECHLAVEGPAGRSMILYRPLDQACTACHGGGE